MAKELEFEWNKGYLRVRLEEGLRIEGSNVSILLAPREVRIKGVFMDYKEYFIDRRQERKVVYVRFAFPSRGIEGQPRLLVMNTNDYSIGPFGISYTKIDGIEYYLTIYPPPGYLYDNAVLTTRMLALFMIGRRQVYLMREENDNVLVLV
ncbi:MAG: hypothetical protein F7B95_02370 [Desulfurococcales archaeon]|nr:hypothetical protein [Desulfurococcales archaeon]